MLHLVLFFCLFSSVTLAGINHLLQLRSKHVNSLPLYLDDSAEKKSENSSHITVPPITLSKTTLAISLNGSGYDEDYYRKNNRPANAVKRSTTVKPVVRRPATTTRRPRPTRRPAETKSPVHSWDLAGKEIRDKNLEHVRDKVNAFIHGTQILAEATSLSLCRTIRKIRSSRKLTNRLVSQQRELIP